MTIRTLIVDDEYPARQELRYLLQDHPDVEVVGEATSAQEARKLLEALDYDLVFLDIHMPGKSGLELGAELSGRPASPHVIFVTAYEQHAVEAFNVNAVDYLLKPVNKQRLAQALAKVRQLVERERARAGRLPGETAPASHRFDRIPVEKQGKTLLISQDEVYYAYSQNNSVYIKTLQDVFFTRYSLKELEARLDPGSFFRTHRCYIVNLTRVQEIIPFFNGTFTLVVSDNKKSELPVSRNQARKLRRLLGM